MASEEKKLSSVLLEMKFMQRTKKRLDEEEKGKQEKKLESSFLHKRPDARTIVGTSEKNVAVKDEPSTSEKVKYVFDMDSSEIEDQLFGRMSFQGCNPEVEKLMKYYRDLKDGITPEDDVIGEKDVGDEEMADALGSSAVAKKFATKKERATNEGRTLIDETSTRGRGSNRRENRYHSHPYRRQQRRGAFR